MSPLSDESITTRLRFGADNPMSVGSRESSNLEFKENYNHGSMAMYFRTMAAFANNAGGYIVFGVTDSPRIAKGMNARSLEAFESIQPDHLTQNLANHFDPEISWDHRTFQFCGKAFGVIYVTPLKRKPCVCKQTVEVGSKKYWMRESDIYYRYAGRSERIRFSELRSIMDEAREIEQRQYLELLRKAMIAGVDNAAILDLRNGHISGSTGTIVIEERLLDKLRFVNRGHFVEDFGAPALRLMGDVNEIRGADLLIDQPGIVELRSIESSDVVSEFLRSEGVDNPLDYVRRICSESSGNYPIYHFLRMTEYSMDEIIETIEMVATTSPGKAALLARLRGKRLENISLPTTSTQSSIRRHALKDRIIKEKFEQSQDCKMQDVKDILAVLMSLEVAELTQHESYLKSMMLQLYFGWIECDDSSVRGNLRKVICRLDESLNT